MATSFAISVTTTLLSYWLMRSFVISMQAYKYEQLCKSFLKSIGTLSTSRITIPYRAWQCLTVLATWLIRQSLTFD